MVQDKNKKGKKDIMSKKGIPSAVAKTEKETAKDAGLKSIPPQKSSPPPQKTKEPRASDLRTQPLKQFEQRSQPKLQKIEPERKAKAEKVFVDSYELPASYNTTSLTMIVRDPHWIYAYWEIAPSSIEEIRNKIGSSEFERSSHTLRMYNVTCIDFNGNNANYWFDIDVGSHTNNWYINIWNDNATYCGEIGIRASDGRFFPLARSNFVTTPRTGSAGRSDLIWMEAKEDLSEPPYVIVERPRPAAGPTPAKGDTEGSRRKIFLTEADIRTYYSRLFPLLRQVIAARRGKGVSQVPFKYILTGGDIKGSGILLENFLIRGLSRSEFIKRIILGSSEELVLLGASEFVKEKRGGASEREQKKRKFFFDIGTELIVYGRTEPDAEVWLGDKKIKLREDGTFSLRFALPEGKIPLDFVAQSHDKVEKRSITTEVERTKTRYSS